MSARIRILVLAIVAVAAAGASWQVGLLPQIAGAGAAVVGSPAGAPATGASQAATSRGSPGGPQTASRTVIDVVAVTGTLPITRLTVGWITSPASISLTSLQSGTVARLVAADGADVMAGDVIVQFDDRAAQLSVARDTAQLQRDQATKAQADLNASRAQTLLNSGAGTKQAADDTATAAQIAAGSVAIDNAALSADKLTLANMQIRAPFAGRLGAFQVSVGSVVPANAPLVTLTQMTPVLASFALSQADLQSLKAAIGAGQASVGAASTSGSGQAVTGHIDFVDSTVDPASGTFKARATLANDALALIPGESVSVTVNLGETTPMVLVPAQAVQAASAGFQAYVVKPDQTVDVRNVTLGPSAGGQTGILAGVAAGDRVITEGQIRLTQGMKVAEVPAASPGLALASAGGTGP
jgi:multidrug efflux system membrane fusion protein